MPSSLFPVRVLVPGVALVLAGCTGWQPTTGVISMTLGGAHTCSTVYDNGMRCWGENQSGQLGNGTNVPSAAPVAPITWGSGPTGVGGGVTILDVAAGDSHTCAIGSHGKPFCWGSNFYGQLGLGSTTDFNISQPVKDVIAGGVPRQATFIAAGDNHTCAVYGGGSVGCWGRFYDKEPQGIPGLANVQRIAAGGNQTCVVEGGVVKCWQMLVTTTPAPYLVAGVTAKAIAVGRAHACAIDTTGAVQCWGQNGQGQLGIGNRLGIYTTPVTVVRNGPFVEAVGIAAGGDHTCALLASGAVECWGSNLSGQTGDPGTSGYTVTPFPVIASGASGVAAGAQHSCARVVAGNVAGMRCWGSNVQGQLGNATAGATSVAPVPVLGLP